MSVEIWFRDHLDTEVVAGDIVDLTNGLNMAAANGRQYVILDRDDGNPLMVDRMNIIKAKDREDVFAGE